MVMSIYVRSGTGGHFDCDGCDLLVKEISTDTIPVPRIGESIDIWEDNDDKTTNAYGEILKEYHTYLVTDVCYWIQGQNCRAHGYSGGASVYVVPVGRHVGQEAGEIICICTAQNLTKIVIMSQTKNVMAAVIHACSAKQKQKMNNNKRRIFVIHGVLKI